MKRRMRLHYGLLLGLFVWPVSTAAQTPQEADLVDGGRADVEHAAADSAETWSGAPIGDRAWLTLWPDGLWWFGGPFYRDRHGGAHWRLVGDTLWLANDHDSYWWSTTFPRIEAMKAREYGLNVIDTASAMLKKLTGGWSRGGETVPIYIRADSTLPPKRLVFEDVTVVDVEQGKRVPHQRVVVVGNHIEAVGGTGTVETPQGAQVVDAKGKYLIPGLWDVHTHPGWMAKEFYKFFLANGVTGIRDAGSEVPLDTLHLWRREILAGARVGPPRQLLSGQAIAGPKEGCRRSPSDGYQTCVADSADAVHYVDSIYAAGANMIKPRAVNNSLYFTIAAAARRLGVLFGGHTGSAIDASDSGASVMDHGAKGLGSLCWTDRPSASIDQCRPLAERLRKSNTWFVPTFIRINKMIPGFGARGTGKRSAEVADYFEKRAGEFWAGPPLHGNWLRSVIQLPDNASAADSLGSLYVMQQTGVPILAGTDVGPWVLKPTPPGFGLHAELAMYVAEGLTPLNALQTATLNPAKMLRATDSLGTVAPGKLADLVLLDADPLADITNTTAIRAVMANGRYFDRAALDAILAEVRTQSP